MVDSISGTLAAVFGIVVVDWVSNNPIIAAVLFGLLALVFFFYLLFRRTVREFREGMRGQ